MSSMHSQKDSSKENRSSSFQQRRYSRDIVEIYVFSSHLPLRKRTSFIKHPNPVYAIVYCAFKNKHIRWVEHLARCVEWLFTCGSLLYSLVMYIENTRMVLLQVGMTCHLY